MFVLGLDRIVKPFFVICILGGDPVGLVAPVDWPQILQ